MKRNVMLKRRNCQQTKAYFIGMGKLLTFSHAVADYNWMFVCRISSLYSSHMEFCTQYRSGKNRQLTIPTPRYARQLLTIEIEHMGIGYVVL